MTPYMGWNTFYGLGAKNYTEHTIVSEAYALVALGLDKAGYRYVWLDDGWWTGARNRRGDIVVDRRQWPHGMRWLTDHLHAMGLRAGIYVDTGRDGCSGPSRGSLGHYQQDADQFADWGFDAVKADFCGGARLHVLPAKIFGAFSYVVHHNAAHRPMLLDICNPFAPGGHTPLQDSAYFSYTFGQVSANSWRTGVDLGLPGHVVFASVDRAIDADATHPEAAGPGHWNDPDYLVPQMGMNATEFETQVTMWSELAAPLVIGADLRGLSAPTLASINNPEVIAIDQDPLGRQGVLVADDGRRGQVWSKPLANGDVAVVLLNRGGQPDTITTTAVQVGMPAGASYGIRDLWAHQSAITSGSISDVVASHAAVMYRVTRVGS